MCHVSNRINNECFTYQQLLLFKRPLCIYTCGVCTAEPQIPGKTLQENPMEKQLRLLCMSVCGVLVLTREKIKDNDLR